MSSRFSFYCGPLMADALVVILDIGTTMCQESTEKLESAIETVNLLLQQKILFKPKDQVGLVLFGSIETLNALQDDGYENIKVERDISIPDVELLHQLKEIQPGEAEGDFIDALIIGMDMLVEKVKGSKLLPRLFLVTNAAAPANTDSLDVVLEQLKKMEAQLNVIGIDFSTPEDLEDLKTKNGDEIINIKVSYKATRIANKLTEDDSLIKKENEKLLYHIADEVDGIVLSLPRALEVMSHMRSTSVLQRPVFNGSLQISPDLIIAVKSFIKTKSTSFPTMKKTSLIAKGLEEAETTEVVMDRTYHSIDDLDNDIPKQDTVKGYKYGRSLVPISKIDEMVLQYTCDACLQLIGFTKASNVPRHHYMGNTEIVSPIDARGSTMISALVRSMVETESVAIVRYSPRKNSVRLAVLSPHISAEHENFYLHKLPYAEDLRHFPFPPLDPKRARPSIVPTTEQLDAIDTLIDQLDLSEAGVDEDGDVMELLKPKYTFNPVIQYFYKVLHIRAMDPEAPIPKMPKEIEDILNPDTKLFAKAEAAMEQIEELFNLELVNPNEKVQTRYWADSNVDELRLESYAVDDSGKKKGSDAASLSIDSIIDGGTSDVGSIDPVKDFEKMVSRRDVDLVDKAIEQMKERILQLLNDSVKDQLYPKAFGCVEALRVGCVQEEEPAAFNSFLRLMRTLHEGKRHDAFWLFLVEKKVSLIHEEECEESDVPKEDSEKFLESAPQPVVVDSVTSTNEDEVDDLFDMIE